MKHMLFLGDYPLSFRMRYTMSISDICRPEYASTLHLMQLKTQGKNRLNRQQQYSGRNLEEVSLQSWLRLEQAESVTIMSHSELLSRLTAPILRPQPTTMQPSCLRYLAALSASLLQFWPRVMQSASSRLPQPLKSKQASPTCGGREGRKRQPSKRLEPLPWRQRMTQRILDCLQRESSKPMLMCYRVKRWVLRLAGSRMLGLQRKRGGRISMKASRSHIPSGQYYLSQKPVGFLCLRRCQREGSWESYEVCLSVIFMEFQLKTYYNLNRGNQWQL